MRRVANCWLLLLLIETGESSAGQLGRGYYRTPIPIYHNNIEAFHASEPRTKKTDCWKSGILGLFDMAIIIILGRSSVIS